MTVNINYLPEPYHNRRASTESRNISCAMAKFNLEVLDLNLPHFSRFSKIALVRQSPKHLDYCPDNNQPSKYSHETIQVNWTLLK